MKQKDFKKVVILGSTGSIGISTLKVIARYSEQFKIVGLTAYNNIDILLRQVKNFQPRYVAVPRAGQAKLKAGLNGFLVKILDVNCDLPELVSRREVDIVVIGMRGSEALIPFLSAVRAGKTVAPANKEALVVAGDLLMKEAQKHGAKIIPVDSEQSAIFQCLEGRPHKEIKRVYLTASGGALRKVPQRKFAELTVKEVLNHPRWRMGKKITVDSALLMNKGFEVIEAKRLFQLDVNQIEVVLHPEAIIHSMVGFKDGSVLAQLGVTDMRLPIQYALTYPRRLPTGLKDLNFFELKSLTFERPDIKKFPALSLCLEVAKADGTLPSVLNAADEVAVEAFLDLQISFSRIYPLVEKVVRRHKNCRHPQLNDIRNADLWAREETKRLLN